MEIIEKYEEKRRKIYDDGTFSQKSCFPFDTILSPLRNKIKL